MLFLVSDIASPRQNNTVSCGCVIPFYLLNVLPHLFLLVIDSNLVNYLASAFRYFPLISWFSLSFKGFFRWVLFLVCPISFASVAKIFICVWGKCWTSHMDQQKRTCLQRRRHGFNHWVGKISWRKAWQPIPVFLLGKSHEQRSLACCSPWSRKESDTT